ncbi:MAG: T9SS type A sorting domain-containing protein, partial [Flavobacterium sp.]|uniref:T9SS type A sorting domain-containing protein n=1 Tax=Flavobacterium sp. TaxID=239 RepID=UPI00326439CD
TSRTSAANNYWTSVTYGNGKFVAVSNTGSGTGDRIMTSLDGITWTSSSGLPDGAWESIVYGNNKFVAISSGSVISSTDGIAWITDPTNLPVKSWKSITYGNGLFVAVCFDTTSNYCVVTSPDGITWTPQFSAANNWSSVTYGNSLFVAISRGGGSTTNVVVTSPDGINWTGRTVPAQLNMTFMFGVCYGNNLFVGVGANMMGNDIMTSPYDATLASANFDFSLQLSVFPNPFTEQFVISSEKEATVEIFNVIGKQIGNQKINLGENVVDLSSHPAGMYFVKLTTENGSKTIKMIKN